MESTGEKRVAAVVGVGSGLGAALARRFAAGYKVALIARSAEIIEKVSDEIRAAGGFAVPIQSDATIEGQIAATHEQIQRELGPVEILIYNGGRRPMGRLAGDDTRGVRANVAAAYVRRIPLGTAGRA